MDWNNVVLVIESRKDKEEAINYLKLLEILLMNSSQKDQIL